MSTIQCQNCGKRIINKGSECPHCGEPIPPGTLDVSSRNPSKVKRTMEHFKQIRSEEPKADGNLIACNACKEQISKNTETCPHCGEPVPKKKKIPLWNWLLILLLIGWVGQKFDDPDKNSNVSSSSYSKPDKPKKERRKTLKGGYFACTSEALFDEMTSATVNKDNLAIGHLLTKGCVLTKAGVRISIIDFGFGTTKIRAYIGSDSVVLYTNTENIYY